ncbi:MAG: cell division protein FtsB [Burkholderiales bacterium]|nr:cell division protein FtsB [Burkholderiales bacterium]
MVRFLPLLLIALIALIQYPLWLGKGSWLRVWEVDRKLTTQREINAKLIARNSALDAEVRDLKQGLEAIEERARAELGMVKQDEIFVQVLGGEPVLKAQKSNPTAGKGEREAPKF